MNATQQKFKPILFSTEMVQAILAGRKTQTRRVIKINSAPFSENFTDAEWKNHLNSAGAKLLYGGFEKGDILWVRETWQKECEEIQIAGGDWSNAYLNATGNFVYRADNILLPKESIGFGKWKPSIFMPKEAARIFLKVTNVRVERLQDISEEDAVDEGVRKCTLEDCEDLWENYNGFMGFYEAKDSFQSLWQSINAKKHPWESNPWVWVYEFERIEKPENFN